MRSLTTYTSSLFCLILLFLLSESAVPAAHAQGGPPPADPGSVKMVEVDGHSVRVQVLGLEQRREGEPVVVLEAGAGNPLDVWGLVLPHIAESAPIVTYDRAGLGNSEWDDEVPTPQHVAQRLRSVLDQIGVEPPYLLVGYSWGGSLVRYFAGLHPEEVAGIVYVDPGPIVTQQLEENFAPFEAIGAGREGYEALWSQVASIYEQAPPPMRAEFEVFRGLMEQEVPDRGLMPVPEVPVAVILTGKYEPPPPFLQLPYDPRAHFEADLRHKIKMVSEWALESPKGTFVVSRSSSHSVLREEPDLVVWAIRRVLAAALEEP
jgi:pimeloyl-ACP methyl ester carboxylesterase